MNARVIVTATATLALLIAPAADAKPKAKLRVKAVDSPPATVQQGGSFETRGVVRNGGTKGGKGKVRVFLRNGASVHVGATKVTVPAKSNRAFSAPATVPAGLAPGAYRLAACIKSKKKLRCRTAKGTVAVQGGPPPPGATPGSRSLGDPLFPQTGNGGYDARHYDIDLDYDPLTNVFNSATTTISARATQALSEFSFDFQDLDVSSVTVNGVAAQFEQVDAEPQLSDNPVVTQPMKLVVTPATPLADGQDFSVVVNYSGTPVRIIDADTSSEGWIPACYGPSGTPTCDGSFVVNEPNGSQGWYPSNDHPTDKATFDTSITVPNTHVAWGIGELESRVPAGLGTWTWNWSEDDLTSTYLTTATVGLFDYSVRAILEDSTGRALPGYFGIDTSFTPTEKSDVDAIFSETEGMLNFLSDHYGAYPLDSIGGVQDRTVGVGYALEVQTKPHYASLGSISLSTHLHEIAHQWFGNTVTLEQWTDIWFNEGWAQYSEWIWGFETQGGDDPAVIFTDLYDNTDPEEWEVAPAVLDGDPSLLFSGFPQYDRGAMVVYATSVILGEQGFAELIDRLMTDFRYDNVSTQEFIALVEEISGFSGQQLETLGEFYDQWLYGEEKPTLLPEDVLGAPQRAAAGDGSPRERASGLR